MKTGQEKKIITPGRWFVELDEQGNMVNITYDESYLKLLGYENESDFLTKWESRIHPDDRKRVLEYTDNIISKHPEGLNYDIEYRMMTNGGEYHWLHDYGLCTRRDDGSLKRCDGVIFDIQEAKDYEERMRHDELKNEILDYIANHDDEDPVEVFKGFAEKIRVLIDCDQVIYRDLEETRFMVNSPAIEETWSVPISFCQQCEHFDAHHPMYKDGYTEMENCQEGWQGIPVFHKCPIKSSLTRIVYCDGEVAGYMAFHYVQKYHHFTDIERQSLEEIVQNLSLMISRYEAKKKSSEAENMKKMMNMIFSLSDEFDPIMVLRPETGEYDWYMGMTEDVVSNTAMSSHGTDFYKDVTVDCSTIIHPEDRPQFQAFYSKENMLKVAKEGKPREIENRWFIKLEGMYKWKYNKVVTMKDDNGKTLVVVGVIDTTEKKEKEKEYEEQMKTLRQNQEMIVGLANEYHALYYVNIKEGVFKIYSIDYNRFPEAKQMVEGKSNAAVTFQMFGQSPLVHPDDRAVFADMNTETILQRLAHSKKFTTRYRRKFGDQYLWTEMDFIKYEDIDEPANIIAVGFAERDSEIRREQEQELQKLQIEKDNEIIRAITENNQRVMVLEDNFESLYDVELESGKYTGYVKGEFYQGNVVDKLVTPGDYFEDLRENIDAVIYPEDRDALFEVLTRDAIRKALEKEERFEHYYRIMMGDTPLWFKIRVVYKDKDRKSVIIGVFNASEELRIKHQEQHRYEELISTFASRYEAVFIENLNDGTYQTMSDSQKINLKDGASPIFGKLLKYFVTEYVHPFDRHLFDEKLFDKDTTNAMLKAGQDIRFEFRNCLSGEYVWHLVRITRLNENEVLFGFADCDDEVVARLVRDKLIDEYDALYVLDLDRDEIRPARASRVTEVGVFQKKINYHDVAMRFADVVDRQYRDDWVRFSDVEYLKEYMSHDDHREYVYVLPDAKKTLRRFTVDVLDRIDGEAKTVLLSFMGIDDLHAKTILLNAKLAEQTVQLEDALSMAKTASNAKTSFLFNMSHDIRTPINAITGFTLMAKKYANDQERVTDYLEKIDVSGQQLLSLVNQVLEMARIESGKIEFDDQPVNIKDRYDVMITVLSEQASIKGLTFTHTLHDITHYNILADDTRMSQITLNIVGNAIKYTPEGGTVDFSLREIPARKEGYASYVFTVADTGIGMSEEFIKVLFEPFSREKSSTVSKIQGTGLGMSIVKNLVDLAGGNIEVQSKLGEGTRFDITLDFKIDEAKSTVNGQQSTEDSEGEIVNLKGKKILLVEDNELNREIARFLLEDLGMEVYEATDGTYAVEEIKNIIDRGEPNFYDLILMDIQMPMMDGYEATRQIRKLEAYPQPLPKGKGVQKSLPSGGDLEEAPHRIPIIAVSANAFAEDKQKSLEAGMDDHIAKPIDLQELMSTMAKVM